MHEEDSAGGCAATRQNLPACSSIRPTSRADRLLPVTCACIGSYRRVCAGTLPHCFYTGAIQLAADSRSAACRLRRHTALQNSTFSHSRAVLRLNSIVSPQTLHTLTADLPRFKARTLLLDSDMVARLQSLWTLVCVRIPI
jgi:hypothetical protein